MTSIGLMATEYNLPLKGKLRSHNKVKIKSFLLLICNIPTNDYIEILTDLSFTDQPFKPKLID